MALTKCPDCQREHSDAALTCPQCGRPAADESGEIVGQNAILVDVQIPFGRAMGNLTDAEILAQIPAATAAATAERKRGLLANAVRYDAATHRFLLELTNGILLGVPVGLLPGLEHATRAQLAAAVVTPSGAGLHIAALDADFSVPGIVESSIGRPADARAFASAGGRSTSEVKARTARENGAKGGRPRKAIGG